MALPTQAPAAASTPLTQVLQSHSPHLFSLATIHPFLHSAGLGTLPKSTLSKWLAQDRLYAQSYVSFIGALIARVHLPHAYVQDKSNSLRWRIAKLLTGALNNIHREIEFFEDVASRYGLDLEASPGHWKDGVGSGFQAASATKQYEALFRAFGTDPSMSLLEGLVVLWATEQVYLSAWRYAASQSRQSAPQAYSPLTSANGNPRGDSPSPPQNYNALDATGADTDDGDETGVSTNLDAKTEAQTPAPKGEEEADPSPQVAAPPQEESPTPAPDRYIHDLDGGALRREFIPNWTSPEFGQFVQEIADVTDELAQREEAWRKIDVYKAVWEHILEVERKFWPDIGVSQ